MLLSGPGTTVVTPVITAAVTAPAAEVSMRLPGTTAVPGTTRVPGLTGVAGTMPAPGSTSTDPHATVGR
jgi:hypothetical protein